jgi:hypothetical protein
MVGGGGWGGGLVSGDDLADFGKAAEGEAGALAGLSCRRQGSGDPWADAVVWKTTATRGGRGWSRAAGRTAVTASLSPGSRWRSMRITRRPRYRQRQCSRGATRGLSSRRPESPPWVAVSRAPTPGAVSGDCRGSSVSGSQRSRDGTLPPPPFYFALGGEIACRGTASAIGYRSGPLPSLNLHRATAGSSHHVARRSSLCMTTRLR